MPVYVDLQCSECGETLEDQWSSRVGERHYPLVGTLEEGLYICDGHWERLWTMTKTVSPGTHSSEKVVVYESAQEGGHVQYPGRNDSPVPDRLLRRGYVRKELNVRDLASFEKKHGVVNERRHYDRNGKTD